MAKNKSNPKAITNKPLRHGGDRNSGTNLIRKKRQRSKSDESEPTKDFLPVVAASKNGVKATSTPSDHTKGSRQVDIAPHVVQWLETRKKSVPSVLKQVCSITDMDQVLQLLPNLRERERRALIRRLERVIQKNGVPDAKQMDKLGESDDDYSRTNENGHKNEIENADWPSSVEFSNNYRWDSSVPQELKNKYSPSNGVRIRASCFSRKVYFKKISDPNHPACGEYGLYCALPDGAPPGTWLLDYVGHITLGEDQDKQSDYISDFGEKSELACDANSYGNEARFLNDFRNTGKHPNVEFTFRRDKQGELRQGVYVKLKKNSKDQGFDGVKQHEELLVSYGKSYWRSRHGNLTDFVWRLPGQEMSNENCIVKQIKSKDI
ncbi:hypothetical protein HJC23_013274 [Cyclotella cryptica]|uniref:SET domain-containing protein n=1 Tax=Cyclotella cryptica TaxID=29204 RepID=A0ABD3P6Z1_9STRA|eukprot:CCRYP_016905-RA/>CCRYP_016905-RA protein AED:0.10 eAED:0.10 QI:0/-1/0/1/-1/1/1/0/377